MEEIVKEQKPSTNPGSSGKSKLRYPLRSPIRSKEVKPSGSDFSNNPASRRRKATPIVSKSVGVLDLSAKDKSGRPPKRLSIPYKSMVSPVPKSVGNITPISETRSMRSGSVQGKCDTPLSEVSSTSTRKKFNTLASASYWLSQIRLAESATKHSISLGLFKLALEAGCEPIQRVREELKAYIKRFELGEIEAAKELFQSYDITDNQEQVQVSQACSLVPEEGNWSSEDEVGSINALVGSKKKMKPRSSNSYSTQVSTFAQSAKKESSQKNSAAPKTNLLSKNVANTKTVNVSGSNKSKKKPQRGSKPELNKSKDANKKQGKKAAVDEGRSSPSGTITPPAENKENTDALQIEEVSLTEVM